ncbi:MAG: deoxyribose-phosphate aldolase [Tannerellaceae bacterium]|nr:deoxyribose-phosphate aldolase [Tannerellaceae bacterium]
MDRYQEAFGKFEAAGSLEQISEKVNKLLEKEEKNNFTADNLKLLYSSLDLTSLSAMDTRDHIWKLVDRVNDFEGSNPDIPNVAAICVYPVFVATVKQALTAQEVKIACVSGSFPSSQTFPEVKIAETALAVNDGAEEIDIVINLGMLQEENYQELTEEIQEIKATAQDATLKVILETGALQTPELIQKAAILAIYSGADFIKTSTGKEFPGATPEAVYTMAQVIKQYHTLTGNKIGLKVSGGVRTAEEAVKYLTIVKSILGEEWLTNELFRIGASNLADDLLKRLEE